MSQPSLTCVDTSGFITHLFSQSDASGGAAKAAYRLHRSLLEADAEAWLHVAVEYLGGDKVCGPIRYFDRGLAIVKPVLAQYLMRCQKTSNQILHSPAIFPTRRSKAINDSNADVVNLHWICREMMSIEDVGQITKPVVWTMHDSWAFCGAEHHPNGVFDRRYIEGYTRHNAQSGDGGVDINRWTWLRKQRSWKNKQFTIVAPSKWQTQCAQNSSLFKDHRAFTVPNPLPLEIFQPLPKEVVRKALNLPLSAHIILFGAIDGSANPIKGYDLLHGALEILERDRNVDVLCVVVGGWKSDSSTLRFPTRYIGPVSDDVVMALLYNAADVVVVPSRVESFGQVAAEAIACGTPVAAFASTGLLDVVEHEVTGFLASPFETDSLARGILWCLENSCTPHIVAKCRQRAEELWSYPKVSKQYIDIYKIAISDK